MGATKLSIKNVSQINADDVRVENFHLVGGLACEFQSHDRLTPGDQVLVKASFKNECFTGEFQESNMPVLIRRRVVPFMTRIRKARKLNNGRVHLQADVINVQKSDWDFFCSKYKDDYRVKSPFELEIEGKRIDFLFL